jgi:ribosomal protein S18 acetylase RimI-like enzyme
MDTVDGPAGDFVDGLLGRRVALRHRVHGGRLTDAVGELGTADGALVVRTRRGPVRVERSAVVAVRAIPPPVPKRPSWAAVARLENLCADAWPARADRRLGAWRLRAAGGFTGRANAALALGDPGMPTVAALGAVRAFAAEHGVAPRVHVPVGSPWERAVADAGWVLDVGHEAGAEVAVLVTDVARLTAAGEPADRGGDRRSIGESGRDRRERRQDGDQEPAGVVMADRPTDAWWALSLGREPRSDERFVVDPEPGASAPHTAFGLVADAGAVRAAVVDDHLHLSRLIVRPATRRTGVGTRVIAAAAAWGREHGARWAVVQVALHNAPARAFYARLGAVEHHRYRYLVPPG